MKRNLYLLFLGAMMLPLQNLWAQESESLPMSRHVAYAGAGTNVLVVSGNVNYARFLGSSKAQNFHTYLRTGIYALGIFYGNAGPGAHVAFDFLTGKKKNHFEFDLGVVIYSNEWGYGSNRFPEFFPIFNLAYRYQPPGKGLLFKTFLGIGGLGIAVGYAFPD